MKATMQTRCKNRHPGVQNIAFKARSLLWRICQSLTVVFIFTWTANGQTVEVITPGGQILDFYKDCHALVVGVEQYKHWPQRPNAAQDARAVSWELKRLGFSVKLLIDPTMQELALELNDFAQHTGMKTGRGLVFYFCGNSQTTTAMDGKKIGWIIPTDAPLLAVDQIGFEKNAISTYQIADIANQIQSRHALFLFDAPLSADLFHVEPAIMKTITKASTLPTRQFISAGNAGEPVSKNSAFKRFLLQGLGGEADLIHDGVVSGCELGLYLSDRVSKVTRGQLHPQFGKIAVAAGNRGDFALKMTDRRLDIARLFVDAQPESATIRILNIKPQFRQGMELKPGRYSLHVSARGFETVSTYIDLKAGEDRTERISLSKAQDPESIINKLGMQFVRIRPGSFMMGSPASEAGRSNDETQHRVKLTRPFYIQTTEVTVRQFRQFVQATGYRSEAENSGGCWTTGSGSGWSQKRGASWKNPGLIKTEDNLPAICVTWNDARAFARWLSQREHRSYRLPTEAEWEYAGRAGTSTPFSTGRCLSTDEANYAKTGHHYQRCITVFREKRDQPAKAGLLASNPWKLYNIHGNVSEWCLDWYGHYPNGNAINPRGPNSGSERVMRGGHWKADAAGCRSARRGRFPQNFASDAVGFRLVMVP